MSDSLHFGERSDDQLRGAVVVGLVPGQNPRVVREAARFATLFGTSLVVVTVDTARFVSYEDPTGMVQTAAIDLALSSGDADYDAVELETADALAGENVPWTMRQVVGDPALSIADLADRVQASLIVVGTRRPGFGESLREFFTGSVAARLAHRQTRSLLVVPNGEPVPPGAPIIPEA